MSKFSRNKGASGERQVRDLWRSFGFSCDRTPNSGALRIRADLYGDLPLHVEVKWQERVTILDWIRQTLVAAGRRPSVVFWRTSRMRWRADVDGELFVRMCAELDARGVSLGDADPEADIKLALEAQHETRTGRTGGRKRYPTEEMHG